MADAAVVDAPITYDLKLAEGSALDAADVTKVTEYATSKKYTNEQAAELLAQREEAAVGVRTRLAAANAPPEKYTLAIDAEKSVLNQADVDKVIEFATANKLTQAQAEVILKQREEAATGLIARQQAFLDETITGWKKESETDPQMGGTNWVGTVQNTKRVMDQFAPESSEMGKAFRKALIETGYGNKREVVWFLNEIGKAMREDGNVTIPGDAPKPPTAQDRYKNSNMNP